MELVKRTVEQLTPPRAATRMAKLRARLRRGTLDRRLALGVPPSDNAELSARATVLLRRATRVRIAQGIESAVAVAHDVPRPNPLHPGAPVAGQHVRDAIDELVALALRLRAPESVMPQGVALARTLLVDGTGPLYVLHGTSETLPAVARRALDALDDGPAWT